MGIQLGQLRSLYTILRDRPNLTPYERATLRVAGYYEGQYIPKLRNFVKYGNPVDPKMEKARRVLAVYEGHEEDPTYLVPELNYDQQAVDKSKALNDETMALLYKSEKPHIRGLANSVETEDIQRERDRLKAEKARREPEQFDMTQDMQDRVGRMTATAIAGAADLAVLPWHIGNLIAGEEYRTILGRGYAKMMGENPDTFTGRPLGEFAEMIAGAFAAIPAAAGGAGYGLGVHTDASGKQLSLSERIALATELAVTNAAIAFMDDREAEQIYTALQEQGKMPELPEHLRGFGKHKAALMMPTNMMFDKKTQEENPLLMAGLDVVLDPSFLPMLMKTPGILLKLGGKVGVGAKIAARSPQAAAKLLEEAAQATVRRTQDLFKDPATYKRIVEQYGADSQNMDSLKKAFRQAFEEELTEAARIGAHEATANKGVSAIGDRMNRAVDRAWARVVDSPITDVAKAAYGYKTGSVVAPSIPGVAPKSVSGLPSDSKALTSNQVMAENSIAKASDNIAGAMDELQPEFDVRSALNYTQKQIEPRLDDLEGEANQYTDAKKYLDDLLRSRFDAAGGAQSRQAPAYTRPQPPAPDAEAAKKAVDDLFQPSEPAAEAPVVQPQATPAPTIETPQVQPPPAPAFTAAPKPAPMPADEAVPPAVTPAVTPAATVPTPVAEQMTPEQAMSRWRSLAGEEKMLTRSKKDRARLAEMDKERKQLKPLVDQYFEAEDNARRAREIAEREAEAANAARKAREEEEEKALIAEALGKTDDVPEPKVEDVPETKAPEQPAAQAAGDPESAVLSWLAEQPDTIGYFDDMQAALKLDYQLFATLMKLEIEGKIERLGGNNFRLKPAVKAKAPVPEAAAKVKKGKAVPEPVKAVPQPVEAAQSKPVPQPAEPAPQPRTEGYKPSAPTVSQEFAASGPTVADDIPEHVKAKVTFKHGHSYLPIEELNVDPQRFQYKIMPALDERATKKGEVGNLRGVQRWNEVYARPITVWVDPADGKVYVVNGHQRVALADRLNREGKDVIREIPVMFLDAKTAEEARFAGAAMNINAGQGTSFDAAKLFKDSGMTAEQLREAGINLSPKNRIAAEGWDLSGLSDELLEAALNEEIKLERARIIGRELRGKDGQQQELLAHIREYEKTKRKQVTNEDLHELIQMLKKAQVEAEESLFGDIGLTNSSLLETANIRSWLKSQLGKDKKFFSGLARVKGEKAEALADAGNVLNVEENAARLTAAEKAMNRLDQELAGMGKYGEEINDLIAKAVSDIKGGESDAKVRERLLDEVKARVLSENDGQRSLAFGEDSTKGADDADGGGLFAEADRGTGEPDDAGPGLFGEATPEPVAAQPKPVPLPDDTLQDAMKVFRDNDRVSITLLQKEMHLDYTEAHAIMERLEKAGKIERNTEGKGYLPPSKSDVTDAATATAETKPVASFDEMAQAAADWRAAVKLKQAELEKAPGVQHKVGTMTTQENLDDYLMRKFGISKIEARRVSNDHMNRKMNSNKDVSLDAYGEEEWAKLKPREPKVTGTREIPTEVREAAPAAAKYPKSQGHFAFVESHDGGEASELFIRNGELYRAPVGNAIMPDGYRSGRWENKAEKAEDVLRNMTAKPKDAPSAPKAEPGDITAEQREAFRKANQPVTKQGADPKRPWLGVEDEYAHNGTRVHVAAAGKANPAYDGEIYRSLNNGELLEIAPDGMSGTKFRVKQERVTLATDKPAEPSVFTTPKPEPVAEAPKPKKPAKPKAPEYPHGEATPDWIKEEIEELRRTLKTQQENYDNAVGVEARTRWSKAMKATKTLIEDLEAKLGEVDEWQEAVQKHFGDDVQITRVSKDGSYTVDVKGKIIRVRVAKKIDDGGEAARVGDITVGQFTLLDEATKTELQADALIELLDSPTTPATTLRHETFHAAYHMALDKTERAAVIQRFRRPGMSVQDAEEAAARWYQNWRVDRKTGGEAGWAQKLYDWAREIYYTLADPKFLSTMKKIDTGEVWKAKPTPVAPVSRQARVTRPTLLSEADDNMLQRAMKKAWDLLPKGAQHLLPSRAGLAHDLTRSAAEYTRHLAPRKGSTGRSIAEGLLGDLPKHVQDAIRGVLRDSNGLVIRSVASADPGNLLPVLRRYYDALKKANPEVETMRSVIAEGVDDIMGKFGKPKTERDALKILYSNECSQLGDDIADLIQLKQLELQFGGEASKEMLFFIGRGDKYNDWISARQMADRIIKGHFFDQSEYQGIANELSSMFTGESASKVYMAAGDAIRRPKGSLEYADLVPGKRYYPIEFRWEDRSPNVGIGKEVFERSSTEAGRIAETKFGPEVTLKQVDDTIAEMQGSMTFEEIAAHEPRYREALETGVVWFVEDTVEAQKALSQLRAQVNSINSKLYGKLVQGATQALRYAEGAVTRYMLMPMFQIPIGRYGSLSLYDTPNMFYNIYTAAIRSVLAGKFDVATFGRDMNNAFRAINNEGGDAAIHHLLLMLEEQGALQGITSMRTGVQQGELPSMLHPSRMPIVSAATRVVAPFEDIARGLASKTLGFTWQTASDIAMKTAAVQDAAPRCALVASILDDIQPTWRTAGIQRKAFYRAIRECDTFMGNFHHLQPINAWTNGVLRFTPWLLHNFNLHLRIMARSPIMATAILGANYAAYRGATAIRNAVWGTDVDVPTPDDYNEMGGNLSLKTVFAANARKALDPKRVLPFSSFWEGANAYAAGADSLRQLFLAAADATTGDGDKAVSRSLRAARQVLGIPEELGAWPFRSIVEAYSRAQETGDITQFFRAVRAQNTLLKYVREYLDRGEVDDVSEDMALEFVANMFGVSMINPSASAGFAAKRVKMNKPLTEDEYEYLDNLRELRSSTR